MIVMGIEKRAAHVVLLNDYMCIVFIVKVVDRHLAKKDDGGQQARETDMANGPFHYEEVGDLCG